jgi:hypothetical protein
MSRRGDYYHLKNTFAAKTIPGNDNFTNMGMKVI